MKVNYVAGFMFNEDKSQVALIRKKRPSWQAGLLNGIGGKIEDNERTTDAICREFFEETGFLTTNDDWKPFTQLVSVTDDWQVTFYYSNLCKDLTSELKTTTDEVIEIINLKDLDSQKIIPNLLWLVRMALDSSVFFGKIQYI